MLFGQAVQAGYYVLQNARDEYRLACGPAGMHQALVQDYLRVSLHASVTRLACAAARACWAAAARIEARRSSMVTSGACLYLQGT